MSAGGFLPDLWELKDLLQEADEKKFPESELKSTLANAITEAEKCANVANQLVSKKVRTRFVALHSVPSVGHSGFELHDPLLLFFVFHMIPSHFALFGISLSDASFVPCT